MGEIKMMKKEGGRGMTKRMFGASVILVMLAFLLCPAVTIHADDVLIETPYLTVAYPTEKRATLRWNRSYAKVSNKVKKATGYQVQYSMSDAFKGARTFVYDSEKKTVTYSFPKSASSYYMRIRAFYNNNGKKTYSSWRKAKTSVTMPVMNYPTPALSISGNSIVIAWEGKAGAESEVYRQNSDGTWKLLKTLPEGKTTYTDKNRFYDVPYKYLVKLKSKLTTKCPDKHNASHRITKTGTAKEITIVNPLKKPAITNWDFKVGKLTITWTKDANATGYIYEYANNAKMTGSKAVSTTGTKATIKDLPDGDTCYVRVSSFREITSDKVTRHYGSKYSSVEAVSIETYTIKFDSNSGSGTMASIKLAPKETSVLPVAVFTRKGYTFLGWSKKKGTTPNMKTFQYGTPDIKDKASVTDLAEAGKSITLYACWKGSGAEAAADWAKLIAKDDTFTYGSGNDAHHNGCYYCGTNQNGKYGKPKTSKWAKTYCCNPFVYAAYAHGANKFTVCPCTGLSLSYWAKLKSGGKTLFKKLGYNVKYSSLKKGDVLIKPGKHIRIFYGKTSTGKYKYIHAAGGGFTDKSIRIDTVTADKIGSEYYALSYVG